MTCVYASSDDDHKNTKCSNAAVPGIGLVPSEFCQSCPWRVESENRDFWSQTSQLLINKQRRGEISRANKPCGGCGSTKLQFVWPYWHRGAMGDEIRFSVRSVEKFFDGQAKCTIIGDRPPWFTGHFIPKKKVNRAGRYRDMLSKVWAMANHGEVDDEFVLMMDDDYFVSRFTLEDIQLPRAEKYSGSISNKWQEVKSETMSSLASMGFLNHDYATHLPQYAEKKKIIEMYETFDLHHRTLLWEVIYGNCYRADPDRSFPFLRRVRQKMTHDEIKSLMQGSTVLNHSHGAWCDGIRSYLMEIMPNPASVEGASVKESSPVRVVKRRPLHTHRNRK